MTTNGLTDASCDTDTATDTGTVAGAAPAAARVLLLIEDNPADAELVEEMLAESPRGMLSVMHATRLDQALRTLGSGSADVDVVVLDLWLPDAQGVETVSAVRRVSAQVPIVVLTGRDDEELALGCLDAGAQDYLAKSEVSARNLRRAIGYSITRLREAQLREMHATLADLRAMSSSTQTTSVTAALARSGAVAATSPQTFENLVRGYHGLLEPYLRRECDRVQAPREQAERLITVLGDHGGGPRDLLDVHVAAIDRVLARFTDAHSRSVVFEARLLALEMMGRLVDHYRVGHRRRFEQGMP